MNFGKYVNFISDVDVVERKNFILDDEYSIMFEDFSGHGTAIAGVIAAKNNEEGITGINPNVELYSARVLDENNRAPINRIVDAIYWAIEKEVNIISISFGTNEDSDDLRTAIQAASDKGIMMIAAAGNKNVMEFPAAYEEVIAVGSIDSKGERCEGSAIGDELELMAPGELIVSNAIFGGVSVSSGTSMAVPHVVGVASVLWQKDLNCSSEFIRSLMRKSANLYGDSSEYGFGLIDLDYACSIYDDYKQLYYFTDSTYDIITMDNIGEVIGDNTKEIITFNDLKYVEGSWSSEHSSLADYGQNNSSAAFTPDQMKIIKMGCVYQDNPVSELKNMGPNPQLHGYLWNMDGQDVNYISCYIYLTKLANAYGDPSKVSTSGMLSTDVTYMNDNFDSTGIAGRTWSTILGSSSLVTNENKRLFLYGMALHTATDSFAHSTWRKFPGGVNWYRIKHTQVNGKDEADDPNCVPKRFAAAEKVAINVMARAYKKTEGNLYDYAFSNSIYDGNFYMGNLDKYAQQYSSSQYATYKQNYLYGDLHYNQSKIDWN